MRQITCIAAVVAALTILAPPLASAHTPGACNAKIEELSAATTRMRILAEQHFEMLKRDPSYWSSEEHVTQRQAMDEAGHERFNVMVGYIDCAEFDRRSELGSTPDRVKLGVDCTEPFTVGFPDDVLTECEATP